MDTEKFLAARREEGRLINPATAETTWKYGQILDPYGIFELSLEEYQVARVYFARRPGSDVWVELGDLPKETREALLKRGAFWIRKHDMACPSAVLVIAPWLKSI
jgi:hypothetical protein